MKRKKLKIFITITAITLAIIGGVMIPAHLHSGRYVDASAEENVETLPAVPVTAKVEQTPELFIDNAVNKEVGDTVSTNTAETAPRMNLSAENSNEASGDTKHSIADESDYDWVEARIQKHRNEIHEDDLEDFRLIMNKLDLGHISAIVNGEIPGDVEQLLREYLLSQLDGREYERSKTLFLLYNHLMYEE